MSIYKVVDTEKLESELTGMADEVRTLADTDSKMSLEAMTDNVAQANSKVDSQSEIIAQIKKALQGKAIGADPYEVINSAIKGTLTEFYTLEDFNYNVQSFGSVFNGNSNLVKWAVPNYTKTFEGYLFRGCNKLKYIDLGKPTSIHYALFYGHPISGHTIIIRAEIPPKLNGNFSATSLDENTRFFVPKNSLEAYKTATNWSTYADVFYAIEDYPEEVNYDNY